MRLPALRSLTGIFVSIVLLLSCSSSNNISDTNTEVVSTTSPAPTRTSDKPPVPTPSATPTPVLTPTPISTVNLQTIEKDLVGKEFFYVYNWGLGGRKWRVQPNQIKGANITDRFTDRQANSDEIHILATISDGTTTIKGPLVLKYHLYEQGWRLESVEPKEGGPGKSFSFEITGNP